MNKLKTIEYILIMLLCLIIFLLFPLGKIIRLNRIDYFAYNRDVTLNERLSVTAHIAANGKSKIDHYTILPGTVMSSEIIRTNGELNNLSFTSDNGEHITSFGGVPISKFDERDSINEDLALLIKEREHQIDDLKYQVIILAIIIYSGGRPCLQIKNVKKCTYNNYLCIIIINYCNNPLLHNDYTTLKINHN